MSPLVYFALGLGVIALLGALASQIYIAIAVSRTFPFGIIIVGVVFIVVVILIAGRWPKTLEVSENSLILTTLCRRYVLDYSRITSVQYVPNAVCFLDAKGAAPQGMKTALEHLFYFEAPDCGEGILFNPEDPPRLMNMLQKSPIAHLIRTA